MKTLVAFLLVSLCLTPCLAQDTTLTLTNRMFSSDQLINLSTMRDWVFKAGQNPGWASPALNTTSWTKRRPSDLSIKDADKTGRAEGWFRCRIRLDSTFEGMQLGVFSYCWAAVDLYVDGRLITSFGNTGANGRPYAEHYPYYQKAAPFDLTTGQDHLIALHVVDYVSPFSKNQLKAQLEGGTSKIIRIVGPKTFNWLHVNARLSPVYSAIWLTVSFLLATLFWLLVFQNLYERSLIRLLAIGETLLVFASIGLMMEVLEPAFIYEVIVYRISGVLLGVAIAFLPITLLRVLNYPSSRRIDSFIIGISVLGSSLTAYTNTGLPSSLATVLQFLFFFALLIWARKKIKGALWAIVTGAFLTIAFALGYAILQLSSFFNPHLGYAATGFFLSLPLSFLVYIALRFKEIVAEDRAKAVAVVQITEEKRQLLATQNQRLEQQVETRTAQLNQSLIDLRATQAQLIQKEKLASLGELTAGVAHEIQNPLNFVNNFAEVSTELIDELKEGPFQKLPDSEKGYADEILGDLSSNLQKINHHGGRASSIVKGMLEHSRTESGERRPTDLNALADEYLKIAYHGLRAKDKDFNADLKTNFMTDLGRIEVVPQEIGRVLLNLYNNAFYAVIKKQKLAPSGYQPTVTVSTHQFNGQLQIRVSDNGTGMPESVKAKIFQPFFTTKPTSEGTGLGLSLSYDIVTKGHGGTLTAESEPNQGTVFTIALPLT
ncbi:sensor histidine kinase [Spirosoma foliorum]|nr:ATP-binding protein [Spirosoma foliorum]